MTYITEVDDRPIAAICEFFDFDHLSEPMRGISESVADLVQEVVDTIHADSAELTAGLRKLLEAKDCLVRALLIQSRHDEVEVFDV